MRSQSRETSDPQGSFLGPCKLCEVVVLISLFQATVMKHRGAARGWPDPALPGITGFSPPPDRSGSRLCLRVTDGRTEGRMDGPLTHLQSTSESIQTIFFMKLQRSISLKWNTKRENSCRAYIPQARGPG